MLKYKLLALDLDGTLLNSREKISERNLDCVRRAIAADVRVVLTTGRSTVAARRYINAVRSPDPSITYNGGVIKNGNGVLRLTLVAPELVTGILETVEEAGYAPVVYTLDDRRYYANGGRYNEDFIRFSKPFEKVTKKVDDLIGRAYRDVVRISVFTDEPDLDILDRAVMGEFGNKIRTTHTFFPDWGFWIYEIMDAACSKSNALDYVCGLHGITPAEAVAIGDNRNDLDMLAWAGLGVAMKNALPDVYAEADHVTARTNDEDGVAEIIESFILRG